MKKVIENIKNIFNKKSDKQLIITENEKSIVFLYSSFSIYVTLSPENRSRVFIPTVIEKDTYGDYYFTGFMVDDKYADMINIIVSNLMKRENGPIILTIPMIFTSARLCRNFRVPEFSIAAVLDLAYPNISRINETQKALSDLMIMAGSIENKTNWVYLLKEKDLLVFGDAINRSVSFKAKLMNKGKELFIARKKEQILN